MDTAHPSDLPARIRIGWLTIRTWGGVAANAASFGAAWLVIDATLLQRVHWWWAESRYRPPIVIAGLFALVVAVLAHELGHGLVLRHQLRTPVEIRISPAFGYTSLAGQDPTLLGVLAGPLANLSLGLATLTAARWIPPDAITFLGFRFLVWFGDVSVLIGLLNLLPIQPLDGAKVVAILIERRAPATRRRRMHVLLASVGLLVVVGWMGFAISRGAWLSAACTLPLLAGAAAGVLTLADSNSESHRA